MRFLLKMVMLLAMLESRFAWATEANAPTPPQLRVTLELLAGLLGSVGGGIAALEVSASSDFPIHNPFGAALVPVTGSMLGSWLGTSLSGTLCGGEGNVWFALAGAMVGGAAAYSVVVLGMIGNKDGDTGLTQVAVMIFAPLLGAVIGYEVSRPVNPESTISPPVQLIPALSYDQHGRGTIGIAGTF